MRGTACFREKPKTFSNSSKMKGSRSQNIRILPNFSWRLWLREKIRNKKTRRRFKKTIRKIKKKITKLMWELRTKLL